jgi:Aflatoxin regulatory protein/Fungal Zn(2)-Cys(6) binuclear cluster domain
MPGSPTVVADSLPTLKVPKLRSSCEGCGNAKVKCNRGQPKCSRCVGLGQGCVYGISRKLGKPPRKRPSPRLEISNGFPHTKRVVRGDQCCENQRTMGLAQSPSFNNPVQLPPSFSNSQAGILSLPSSANCSEGIQGRENCASMSGKKSQSAKATGQLKPTFEATHVLSTAPPNINTSSIVYEQNQPGSTFLTPFPLDEWPQFDIWGPSLDFPPFSNDSHQATASEPVNNLSANFDSPDSHSCPRGSYELFRDLICPSPFLHAPEAGSATVSARLDEVLHFNSQAIDRLRRLLKCPCAKSGHRIMVHASIISRILIWYQQAAGWTGCSSSESRSSALAASSPSGSASSSSLSLSPSPSCVINDPQSSPVNPPTLVQSTGFAVAKVPLSMGTFNIEDGNVQDAFTNQLVLSELQKLANVIELFTAQHSGPCETNGVAGLYSHLGIWLKSEHLKTVRILRARLGVFYRALNVDDEDAESSLD